MLLREISMTEEMTCCIETCLVCYKTCLSTAMNIALRSAKNMRNQRTFA